MMTKFSKNLEEKENMVGQAKSSIEEIDKRITKAHKLFARLLDVAHTTSAVAARSAAATIQVQAVQVSAVQVLNQATTRVPIAARAQIAAPIQPAAKTPILVWGHTDQKKSFLGKLVASFGSTPCINALTLTAFNGF